MCVLYARDGESCTQIEKIYTICSVENKLEGKTSEYGYSSSIQKVIQIFKMKNNALLDNRDSDEV